MMCFTLPPSGNSVPVSRLLSPAPSGARGFAASLAARCGVPAGCLLPAASGSAALYALLRGLAALEPRRRHVAVPAWCCPSVPQAVLQAGLRPVPVDVDPSTLGYDTAALQEAKGRGLLAVILCHYFALPQPLPPGDWDGTAFIRDCAQDFDHRPDDGIPCVYSFGRGKALNAGHGGALALPSEGPLLRACVRGLAALPESAADPRPMAVAINMLSEPHLYWAVSRLPGLGLGRTEWERLKLERISPRFEGVGLACLEAYASCRGFYGRLVAAYRALFAACDGDWISFPEPAGDGRLPARFPLLVRDPGLRDALIKEVGGRFGGVTRMYPAVLTELPGAPEGLSAGQGFPGARRVARELIALPVTAALRGVEGPFLECLADVLRGEGALRRVPEPIAAIPVPAPDWAPSMPAAPEEEAAAMEDLEALAAAPESGSGEDWTAVPAPAEDEESLALGRSGEP